MMKLIIKLPICMPPPNFVVIDCSPSPNSGDATEKYLKLANLCICPVTLSPLGVGKNGQRITDTLKLIRNSSKNTQVFVLINRYPARLTQSATAALNIARTTVKIAKNNVKDKYIHFFDPDHDGIKIRDSGILERFGDGTPVFPAGQSGVYPREDFNKLISYLKDSSFLNVTDNNTLATA